MNLDDLLHSFNYKIPSVSGPTESLRSGQLSSLLEEMKSVLPVRPRNRPPPVFPATSKVYTVTAPASSVPRVARQRQPYWQERGWKQNGHHCAGYFRIIAGAWKGRAEVRPSGMAQMFIHQPPEFLRSHPHWGCFSWRPGGWYSIHTSDDGDLSAGILRVEEILIEAFRRTHP